MTINLSDNSPRISYSVAEGVSQASFAVPFEFFDDGDLNVYVNGTLKTLTTDYTTTGGDGSTGSITMSVTGASGGSTVVITRDIDIERTTDFPTSGPFQIAALNTELDRITAIAADLDDRAARALQLTDYDASANLTLPDLDTRKGKTLAFNASTGAVEAGPSISDVQTVSAASSDIGLLADLEDGTTATNVLSTLGGISVSIATLGPISTDITTVSGIGSNVTTVASISSSVTNVSSISSDVSTVSGISSDVTTVSTAASNVAVVSANINSVNTVASNIANVNAVAADLLETVSEIETVANDLNETTSEIEVVANNIANVNTVGGISGNVTTVANLAADISSVVSDASDIGVVASNISNVNTVSGISAQVSSVAAIDTSVTNVSNNTAVINNVSNSLTNINSVNNNLSNVNTVAGINTHVTAVSGIAEDVTIVAANISGIADFADVYIVSANQPSTAIEGTLWFDTTNDIMKVYDGNAFQNAGSSVNGTVESKEYTVGTPSGTYTNSLTTFPATYDSGYIHVWLNGVKLVDGVDFTATDGANVVLSSAATNGDVVSIVAYGTFLLADHYSRTAVDALIDDVETLALAGL